MESFFCVPRRRRRGLNVSQVEWLNRISPLMGMTDDEKLNYVIYNAASMIAIRESWKGRGRTALLRKFFIMGVFEVALNWNFKKMNFEWKKHFNHWIIQLFQNPSIIAVPLKLKSILINVNCLLFDAFHFCLLPQLPLVWAPCFCNCWTREIEIGCVRWWVIKSSAIEDCKVTQK